MKAILHLIVRWPGICLILIASALISGCDSSGSVSTLPPTETYRVDAVMVNDLNADAIAGDTSRVAVLTGRNDSLFFTATVTFGDDTLRIRENTFAFDSVYSFDFGPTSLVETGAYTLGMVDSSRFGDTLILFVPDTFSIGAYTPDSLIPNTNGQEIQISWTAAANSDGYIIAVVLEDSAYTGYGYSEYVTSQATSATIPPDAFRLASDTAGVAQLDTGWYNIYVYSFSGHPDSLMSESMLPVRIPSTLSDNVDEGVLTGRIGSVTVTRRVRTHVVSE